MLSTMPSAQGAEEWLPRSRHEASSSGKEVFSSRSSNMTDAEAQQLATMVLKVADLRCVAAAAASLQKAESTSHPSTHSPSSPFPFLYSYPSKGLEYSLKWIDKCLDEFFEQGDREKEMGLAVGYDRETCDKPKSQVLCIGFLFLALALPSRTHLSLSLVPSGGILHLLCSTNVRDPRCADPSRRADREDSRPHGALEGAAQVKHFAIRF